MKNLDDVYLTFERDGLGQLRLTLWDGPVPNSTPARGYVNEEGYVALFSTAPVEGALDA